MNPTMNNVDAMKPCYPDFTNGTDNRNPVSYKQALAQFDVANNPRYTPRDVTGTGHIDTFCNIFLWDGSRALGCEIPHFEFFYGKDSGGKVFLTGREFNANAVAAWFATAAAPLAGWHEASVDDAAAHVNKGGPTVIIWNNPGGIGHVAWMLPSLVVGILRSAQAGGVNFFDDDYRKGFGNAAVKFYVHE
jgi:hypothetical protein